MNKKNIVMRKMDDPRSLGQGLVEMALLIPLLVMFVFGAVDLARAFHAQVTITNASREGARLAMRINRDNKVVDKLTAIKTRVAEEAGNSGVEIDTGDVTVLCGGAPYISSCSSGVEIDVFVDYEFELMMFSYFIPTIDLSHSTKMITP